MRKIVAALGVALVAMLALVGCGSSGSDSAATGRSSENAPPAASPAPSTTEQSAQDVAEIKKAIADACIAASDTSSGRVDLTWKARWGDQGRRYDAENEVADCVSKRSADGLATTIPTTTMPAQQAMQQMTDEVNRACADAAQHASDPQVQYNQAWASYFSEAELDQRAKACVVAKYAALKAAQDRAEEAQREAEAAAAAASVSQENAREKAAEYLDYEAFSRTGLINQLKFEGFSDADAVYGVDAQNADWNDQAAKKAADYLAYTSFSHSSLVDQLVFEGFTRAQAEYGVSTTGL